MRSCRHKQLAWSCSGPVCGSWTGRTRFAAKGREAIEGRPTMQRPHIMWGDAQVTCTTASSRLYAWSRNAGSCDEPAAVTAAIAGAAATGCIAAWGVPCFFLQDEHREVAAVVQLRLCRLHVAQQTQQPQTHNNSGSNDTHLVSLSAATNKNSQRPMSVDAASACTAQGGSHCR